MMRDVLVLGSGRVCRPGVRYLLEQAGLTVTLASDDLDSANAILGGHNDGEVLSLDVRDEAALLDAVSRHRVVVSLLPWVLHPLAAKACLAGNRHLVTTSYVTADLKAFDEPAREKGLLFLNECGLDPGIDHMSAMDVVDRFHDQGGSILSFTSYCGGLPAPECRDNPFGYKFSWSPRGVLLASQSEARFLQDGQEHHLPAGTVFTRPGMEEMPDLGTLEVYPNRDSVAYRDIYHIEEARTLIRGTYRYPGWCGLLDGLNRHGLLDATPRPDWQELSWSEALDRLLGGDWQKTLEAAPGGHRLREALLWLGMGDSQVRVAAPNLLDGLCDLMVARMGYQPGERDMIVLQHRFDAVDREGRRHQGVARLLDYGIPGGDSSMARTVSLPMAVAVELLLLDAFPQRGVVRPVHRDIYRPILDRLETLGLKVEETWQDA